MSRFDDDDELDRPLAARDDEETLFSRDLNGQLVRLDEPTKDDYEKRVTLRIDGRSVTVPLARPLEDAQGNLVLDLEGRTTPRYTTIFDAVTELYVKAPGDESKIPIPTLCHQPHMTPVAVCRLCVVQLYGEKRGKRSKERKLLPACQHQVADGMEVFTMNAPPDKDGKPSADGERVRRAVQVMTELLVADHLKDAPAPAPAKQLGAVNELKHAADRFGLTSAARFADSVFARPTPSPGRRTLDGSSPVFIVDHSACILCDRCWRACDDVKHNDVIGRVGKGATAAIGFDLDVPMHESSCVQCGECMVSCPTSAITFNPVATVKVKPGEGATILTAAELASDPMLSALPPKFLLWQEGLAVRRRIPAKTKLCTQGDPGNTAYLIKSGRFEVTAWPKGRDGVTRPSRGDHLAGPLRFDRGPEDLILGEMACLSNAPRSADITATTDAEVWEVRRNVVDRMMRSPVRRASFEEAYSKHTLEIALNESDLFRRLPEAQFHACAEFLRYCLEFVRVSPRQLIFSKGDPSDCMYLIRLGHVRVTIAHDERTKPGHELFRAPGSVIGEMGLLAISADDAKRPTDELCRRIGDALRNAPPDGLSEALKAAPRNATCAALDHVELVRVKRADFLAMLREFPAVLRALIELTKARFAEERDANPLLRQFVEQGLYQGQSLLVLDLDRCTRCDDCTRACIQQHGTESHGLPITRLVRDGLQFDRFLVATACRSCKDAYCMLGCPVDAIHRGRHQQIVIEDHCIGCGLCERNCPYGNIQTPTSKVDELIVPDPHHPGRTHAVARAKAATCDLCDAGGTRESPLPRCVYACPHDAAHRMTGAELLAQVLPRRRSDET